MSSSNIQDKYLCPICCEVLKSPVYIDQCQHAFCEECVCRVVSLVDSDRDKELLCPICRTPFRGRNVRKHVHLEREISSSTTTCAICGAWCPLLDWDQHSASHALPRPHPQATPLTHAHQHRTPAPNRSTFSCPICPETNLTCLDLISHVNSSHAETKVKKVCPVCASMPWGVADQLSQDIVYHLNYRHKFEYDTFVDYSCDEESIYQAVVSSSITDR